MIRHQQYSKLDPQYVDKKLNEFFKEDNIEEDITTRATQNHQLVQAYFIAKEDLVFVGRDVIVQAFKGCNINQIQEDGAEIKKGEPLAMLSGPINIILQKERVVLNLIQRLSGIASNTRNLVKIVGPHNIQLLDTRKTTPGLRVFEKFAVFIGGGTNHRFSLKEAAIIKDNHLVGNPNIKDAVEKVIHDNLEKDIQVEVDNANQLEAALYSRATSIMLDNFCPEEIPAAIQTIQKSERGQKIYIELSGGITKDNIKDYCIKGVHGISMGALTHNIKSKDISLDLK
tara:strand:+ start:2172 stop:3026 length:855 start_codon:yes stop_codon:yes gene_type:complete